MRIVVNASLLPSIYSSEYIFFLSEIFKRIIKNYPEHHFIFICEQQHADHFAFANNTELIKTKKRKQNAIQWKYWYDIRIPAVLRKYKADLFVSPGLFCSLRTKLPQLLIVADPASPGSSSFFRKHSAKSIIKAKTIITFTQYIKEELTKNHKGNENKIEIISIPVWKKTDIQTDAVKDETKAKYTAGKEFFLCPGNHQKASDPVNLLKAFSLFKKRQQSSFKLVIYTDEINQYKKLATLIETYKYRADVSLVNNLQEDERLKLISSAYAFVYPVSLIGLTQSLIEAMQSNIPVIVSDNPALKEIAANAALYADPVNPQDIAGSMMRIYKDERLRNELIEKGKRVINRLITRDAANEFWQAVLKALL
jgi:glycosyltransferase involved in cell wall biosynthesis